MSDIDGLIVAEYGVNCRFCEEAQLGLARTRKRSEAVLRANGWVKSRGRWYCDGVCVARQLASEHNARTEAAAARARKKAEKPQEGK